MSNITAKQIGALREEAIGAGDIAQRILCDMAIDGEDSQYDAECLDEEGRPDYSGGGHDADELRAIRRALRMSQDEARAECGRVIANARAMADVSTFARLNEQSEIVELYQHTADERDAFGRRYGDRYVYLPMGGMIGQRVTVDADGEALVIGDDE